MKRFLFVLLCIWFSIAQVGAFSDIENNWYKHSIEALESEWIIQWFDDGTFKPHEELTRAELLKILFKSSNREIKDEGNKSCFSDVSPSDWYTKYVCSAKELGFAKGYDDNSFRPGNSLTVLEALVFWLRINEIELRDAKEDEPWYLRYQEFAHSAEIMQEYRYTLDTLISRWQAADMLYKLSLFTKEEAFSSLSAGCNINTQIPSGSHNINVDGVKRNYLLYVPNGISKNNPKGLIVAFHGRTNSNKMVRDYMGLGGGRWGKGQNDYVVAYLAGLGTGPYTWHQESNIDFFDTLLTNLSEDLCIDREKIFVVGHSLGSYMANRVSCRRGDVIRAMVGVASSGNTKNPCTGPIASMTLHLTADRLSPYRDGQHAFVKRSEQNMCEESESSVRVDGIGTCTQKQECSSGNTSLFCDSYSTYQWDTHGWPKNGAQGILDFFRNIEEYTQ